MSPAALRRAHRRWQELHTDLRRRATPEGLARAAPAVSGWSVAQHIEHLCLSDETIAGRLSELDPKTEPDRPPPGPTLAGRMVLLLRRLPKGRRAPDLVIPKGAETATLASRLNNLGHQLAALEPHLEDLAKSRQTIPHPALGHFTPAQWIRFAAIHDHHHLRIIESIEKKTT